MSGDSFMKSLLSAPCECERCPECGGHGNVRKYADDLCELEPCEYCDATGIIEVCNRCRCLEELSDED